MAGEKDNRTPWELLIAAMALLACCLPLLILLILPFGIYKYLFPDAGKTFKEQAGNSSAGIELSYPDNAPSEEEVGNCIDEYIKSQIGEAGLYGHGIDIATAGKVFDVNPGFIVAIAQAESSLGLNITSGTYNYWNYLPGGQDGAGYDFASYEDSINQHAKYLYDTYLSQGQNTITKIGNGPNGTYVPVSPQKYADNDCSKARVSYPSYCPCGFDYEANISYGTGASDYVNAHWIPNVTKFFDQVATRCGYLAPPQSTGSEWCWPTQSHTITPNGHFKDPNYPFKDTLGEHLGIDIAPTDSSAEQTTVSASKGGVITEIVNNCDEGDTQCGGGYGNYIYIDHGNNQQSRYAHLKKGSILVAVGDPVTKSQTLATMDNSGFSQGTHLHFEIRFSDDAQDPETLLGECTSGSACRETILEVAKEKAGMYLNVGLSCCAGFTSTVLEEAKSRGADIDPNFSYTNWAPNFSDQCSSQQETCDPDGKNWGSRIDNLNDVLPGDLILFHRTYNDVTGNTYTHIGIMGENGTFYDCSGTQSRVNYLDSWYIEKFAEGRRICQGE